MRPNSVHIAGIQVTRASWPAILETMNEHIRAGGVGGYISITNTESMYHALRIPEHREFINNADMSLCDGVGVCVVAWLHGLRVERRNGPVLQLESCRYGEERGWRHFFYGGVEGVVDKLVANLQASHPNLVCVGAFTPPMGQLSAEEDERVVALINEARPDILWVGLGLLKQERWIADHLSRIDVPLMVGVGAAFDYHAGTVPWAPAWIRSLGLEWLFRLVLQPRRRAKRYWWSAKFVIQGALSAARARVP